MKLLTGVQLLHDALSFVRSVQQIQSTRHTVLTEHRQATDTDLDSHAGLLMGLVLGLNIAAGGDRSF